MKNIKRLIKLGYSNFLFWLSRKIDYPLLPPDTVQINFTFRCNLACKMCNMNEQMKSLESQGRPTELDSEIIRKVIREAKDVGAKTVLFIGGEPLLKKDLFDLVGYAKEFKLNPIVVTNGVLLDADNIQRCFDSGMEWISISIDAASESVFSKIRGENVLGKIIANINLLNKMKKEANREFPKINTVCTIMNDNLEELPAVIDLCRSIGIARIIFQPVVGNNADQTVRENGSGCLIPSSKYKLLDNIIDGLIEYKQKSIDNFNFIANNVKHLRLIKKYFKGKVKPWEIPCYAGYNRLQIVQEGKIYFCVPQEKYVATFGDIRKNTISDLWFSKEAKIRRRLIRKCDKPCLQWCAYRDDFIEFCDIIDKMRLF